jgi:hypothetical protein
VIMRQYRRSRWLLAILACTLATIARAEVRVEGNLTAVRVTTSNDAISDVLSALAATLNVRYRTAIRLDSSANAIYSGSFREVVARLLDGYNYVIKKDQQAIEIVVIGRRGEFPSAAPIARRGTRRED